MEPPTTPESETAPLPEVKLPKNTKENRYYYRNRERLLEAKRLARLAKKGIDITKPENEIKATIEERRKKKMEFLGVLGETK